MGFLRIIDPDRVELENLHRQTLYTEADAAAATHKVIAAADHLGQINSQVRVDTIVGRLEAANAESLVSGVDLVLDGTDNWPARFIINDACVKARLPWIYAGVVADQAMTMNVIPGRTACLRCIYDQPPPPCVSPTCRSAGVLGPAVQLIAGLEALEAIKLLSGNVQAARTRLMSFELWTNRVAELDASVPRTDCPCCQAGALRVPGRVGGFGVPRGRAALTIAGEVLIFRRRRANAASDAHQPGGLTDAKKDSVHRGARLCGRGRRSRLERVSERIGQGPYQRFRGLGGCPV